MPDSNMISALESLQNTYTQRQKQANGLLIAVKNAVTTSARLNKNLTEYAPQSAIKDKIEQAQQTLSSIQIKEDVADLVTSDLRREAKLLTVISLALKSAVGVLRADTVDVVKLNQAYQALRDTRSNDEALRQILPALERELVEAQNALGDSFGRDLRDALAERDIQIGGRVPRFEIGRFELNVDFARRAASLAYGKTLVVERIPLSIDTALKAYDGAFKLIIGRSEDGALWAKQLHEAWSNARCGRETADQRANVIDCYFGVFMARQKKTFRSAPRKAAVIDYTRAQFAYDLYEFTHHQRIPVGDLQIAVHTATKTEADTEERSLWVVEGDSPHDGRYIGSIEFKKSD